MICLTVGTEGSPRPVSWLSPQGYWFTDSPLQASGSLTFFAGRFSLSYGQVATRMLPAEHCIPLLKYAARVITLLAHFDQLIGKPPKVRLRGG